ncbi:1267_t:CDS:2 [Funneliformis geosporum]|uniref:15503_t:CDS:1 n=1 Tax=Funneliformis geosporum TaxID=1117311 RepID=A0A9W4SNS7_9GLOM|nr:1267_t:CDS:2 [Funneliformis geosporum]CAI2176042.1 15503_t:CDS:2 [Funneliformis geosporum]
MMFKNINSKEMKYGYSVEVTGDNKARIVKPSNFTKIRLSPLNSKFVFHGTRNSILKWMSSHSGLLVEYDPLDQGRNGSAFSPPPSPLLSAYPEVPEIIPSSPTSIKSTSVPSINTTFSSDEPHNITFDLFTIPIKTSALLSDDLAFSRPLNIALNYIPWLEVMLEIRPTDEFKDSKLYPIHRVILSSGLSLSEISKVLEKSWKSLIPDSTAFSHDCFIRNSELLYPRKKTKSNSSGSISANSDNEGGGEEEESEYSYHKEKYQQKLAEWLPKSGIASRVRQKQSPDVIPPGILTPYIIDDVLENFDEKSEMVKEHILSDKRREAEMNEESFIADLPQYENIYKDTLLEKRY